MKSIILIFLVLPSIFFAQDYYFPPEDFNSWESSPYSCDSMGSAELIDFVLEKNTKAFIILKEGKILMEVYSDDFGRDSVWYWASCAKTMTSTLIGMAVNEGALSIDDPTENYLDQWTYCSQEAQAKILIKNQLTMTTGIDESMSFDCTSPSCLSCINEPGSRWFYHNSPYTLLLDVYESAMGQTANQGFNQRIRNKIGMNGIFLPATLTDNKVFWSRARDMARFGLLHLANGNWNGEIIFNAEGYFEDAKNTSQNLNEAYGYLWWLNGKDSYHLPNSDLQFSGTVIPSGPEDMYMALGKNDQKIYIVPSQDLVVIRMGESANDVNYALSSFDNELWEKLGQLNCLLPTSTTDLTKKDWKIFPNPSTGLLHISGKEFNQWQLKNILGQVVLSGIDSNVNVSGIKAGQYILTIYNKDEEIVDVQKLIKQ